MRGGQNRKPTEAHIAEGTHRRGRHGATPNVVGGREPLTPRRGMPAKTAAAFRELAEQLRAVTDVADTTLLEAAAVALSRAREAGADIAKRGVLVEVRRVGRDGSELERLEANPSIAVERNAWQEFRQLADRLGIGPAARGRLASLGIEGKQAGDDLDELAELRERRAGAA